MREATLAILEFLEGWADGFYLNDTEISPVTRPNPDELFVHGAFIGLELYNCPRPPKEVEYSGQAFFSVRTEGGSFYKCPVLVSVPHFLNEEVHDDICAFHAQFGHKDVALHGGKLLVRRNNNEVPYLSLQPGGDWTYWPAWAPKVRPHVNPKVQGVRSFANGGMLKTRGTEAQMIVTQFLGDADVYDSKVIIPERGNITFRSEVCKSMDELFVALINSPNFMRVYDEMAPETFEHRVTMLSEVFDELVTDKYRTDWDGLSDDIIDDTALKILKALQPSVKTQVTAPAPTVAAKKSVFNLFKK